MDQVVVELSAASFSVTADGSGVTYKWQWSIDGGATWSEVPGAAGATYSVPSTHSGMNGLRVRALAINSAGTTASQAARLSIRAAGTSAATLDLLAGHVGGPGTIDGAGTSSRFRSPGSISIDGAGTLYVWDGYSNSASHEAPCLRKISTQGFTGTFILPSDQPAFCNSERSTAFDAAGNMYINLRDGTIRKLTAAGVLTTLAGTPGTTGSSDGTGAAARFSDSGGVAIDATGNVLVADQGNSTIRRITPAGVVSTIAGSPGVRGSADGTGPAALFNFPCALAVDASGNVFVADQWSHTIRKITPAGVVTTFAGLAGQWGGADHTGTAARFAAPSGLALDSAGNLYVADRDNSAIRRITPAGVVTTVAGAPGQSGYADGTGGAARFSSPLGVVVDGAGNLFVADTGNAAIRKITPAGEASTWAGTPGAEGSADGTGAAASFRSPIGVAVAANGDVYVADTSNHTIRQITPSGTVTTLAGFALNPGSTDATGPVARFSTPSDLATEVSGNLLAADLGNESVRAVTPTGQVTTRVNRAATGVAGLSNGGLSLARNIDRPLSQFGPIITYSVLERISIDGSVTALAGSVPDSSNYPTIPLVTGRDGFGNQALFAQTGAIAADASGNLLVADTGNCSIRRVSASGTVSTLAGPSPVDSAMSPCGSANGAGSAARFKWPEGVALDGNGNVYVADTGNHTIRKITPDGTVNTVLGVAGQSGIALGGAPSLSSPRRIAWLGGNRFAITSGNAVLIATLP